ncbi:MAG: hypothetical protein ACLFTT_07480 [Candidatus Hydrogenedentota bacterium]
MLVESPISKSPAWCSGGASVQASAVLMHLSLARNLADFPFPGRCTPEERRQVGRRVLTALEDLDILSGGAHYALADLTSREVRLLAERRLIVPAMLGERDGRSVFVSEDQCLSIMINADDHLCLRLLAPGLRCEEGWQKLGQLDDRLTTALDYAYDSKLGFLTASVDQVGTGLKAGMLLHLPCLREMGRLDEASGKVRHQRFSLLGVKAGVNTEAAGKEHGRLSRRGAEEAKALSESLCSDIDGAVTGHLREALGDLFLLVNDRTLGQSEAEIAFHLRHQAQDLLEDEANARESLLGATPVGLEDRIGRARGIASGAHLLDFNEALEILSSLRLGVAGGFVTPGEVPLNALLLRAQRAHLELAIGDCQDAVALNTERARLFREHFTADEGQ